MLLKLPLIFFLMFKSVILYFRTILGHAPKNDVGKAESIMGGQIMPYTVKEWYLSMNTMHVPFPGFV